MKLCAIEPYIEKTFYAPENWGNGPEQDKNRVF